MTTGRSLDNGDFPGDALSSAHKAAQRDTAK